jgi:hypothetical protein
MNRIIKAISTVGVAIILSAGVSSPAHAIAVGYPDRYIINCTTDTKSYQTYRNYNWFEEVFLGKRDGYVTYYTVRYYC